MDKKQVFNILNRFMNVAKHSVKIQIPTKAFIEINENMFKIHMDKDHFIMTVWIDGKHFCSYSVENLSESWEELNFIYGMVAKLPEVEKISYNFAVPENNSIGIKNSKHIAAIHRI